MHTIWRNWGKSKKKIVTSNCSSKKMRQKTFWFRWAMLPKFWTTTSSVSVAKSQAGSIKKLQRSPKITVPSSNEAPWHLPKKTPFNQSQVAALESLTTTFTKPKTQAWSITSKVCLSGYNLLNLRKDNWKARKKLETKAKRINWKPNRPYFN